MKNILVALALAVAGAMSVTATAAEPARTPSTTQPGAKAPAGVAPEAGRTEVPPMFKELDQDKDGQISREEAKRSADVQANFDAMDTDHNGKISLIEWIAAEKAKQRSKQ